MNLSPLMIVHVGFGGLALVAGFVALFSKKGGQFHRGAGRVFVLSMVVMALVGAYVAYLKPEMITLLAGLFTAYLVVSAVVTVRYSSLLNSWPGLLLALCSACVGVAGLYYGFQATQSADKLYHGFPAGPYFGFGGLAFFAAVFDVKVFMAKTMEKLPLISRHMWRMCVALLIAGASFFDGPGAKVFPEELQGSLLLALPQLVVILLMGYWLVRILYFKKLN